MEKYICLMKTMGHGDSPLRILSSTVSSEPLGKFSTLTDSSTAYQHTHLRPSDPICGVLNAELLQFYYSIPPENHERDSRLDPLKDGFKCNQDFSPIILWRGPWLIMKSDETSRSLANSPPVWSPKTCRGHGEAYRYCGFLTENPFWMTCLLWSVNLLLRL